MPINSLQTKAVLIAALTVGALGAQDAKTSEDAVLQAILKRLDSLEKQNIALTDEVHALREELAAARATSAPSQAPLEERVAVVERRVDEQSQTKVEASQKFPVSLSGMLLFDAFANSSGRQASPSNYFLSGPGQSGATVRQTVLGLDYQGPAIPGGGKVNASLSMDFYSGGAYPSSNWLRIRTAELSFDWANRSFSVGQLKPLISPYNPDSLAETGILPLAGSGNLWVWLPQARYEERLHFGSNSGLTAQAAILQTDEGYAYVAPEYASSLEPSRPAVEGRAALWHTWGSQNRVEIGAGFHASTTRVSGSNVGSRAATLDWLVKPAAKFQFSGTFFSGHNLANIGGMPDSFTELPSYSVVPVHSYGGWFQATYSVTSRLNLNLFSGLQDNRASDLLAGETVRDFTYAGNLMYRLGPNVLLGIEALQLRTSQLAAAGQLHNHYDLSIAYLF